MDWERSNILDNRLRLEDDQLQLVPKDSVVKRKSLCHTVSAGSEAYDRDLESLGSQLGWNCVVETLLTHHCLRPTQCVGGSLEQAIRDGLPPDFLSQVPVYA